MLNEAQTGLSSSSSNMLAEGEQVNLNSELWHACAGPLVSLPPVGSQVVYFPQGHSEQVAASMQREVDAYIPNYSNLPSQLICRLHDVILHVCVTSFYVAFMLLDSCSFWKQVDKETDEVYCQMMLQPLKMDDREPFLVADMSLQSWHPRIFFCKTLTASDTSTHGGFSIPRRAADKVFPPLDFTQQPSAHELLARDLHDVEWKFRHIFRGQPKRHLLTTGWSGFISSKRLVAGDQVLFIRNDTGHLLLGIRRANRPQTVLPLSVLSSDSMHIGVLAEASLAASTNNQFTVFYNPRVSPSEFVIPYSKFEKAVYHSCVSVGMRFRMLFETEESNVRRYMGTITDISDLDPTRWPNSQWRSIKVGWDESTAGERQRRVSLWEIEPLTTFLLYPPSCSWRLKSPWMQSATSLFSNETEVKDSSLWSHFKHGNNGSDAVERQCAEVHPMLGRAHMGVMSSSYDSLGTELSSEISSSKQSHMQVEGSDPVVYKMASQLLKSTVRLPHPQDIDAFVPSQELQQSRGSILGQHELFPLEQMAQKVTPILRDKLNGLSDQQIHIPTLQEQIVYGTSAEHHEAIYQDGHTLQQIHHHGLPQCLVPLEQPLQHQPLSQHHFGQKEQPSESQVQFSREQEAYIQRLKPDNALQEQLCHHLHVMAQRKQLQRQEQLMQLQQQSNTNAKISYELPLQQQLKEIRAHQDQSRLHSVAQPPLQQLQPHNQQSLKRNALGELVQHGVPFNQEVIQHGPSFGHVLQLSNSPHFFEVQPNSATLEQLHLNSKSVLPSGSNLAYTHHLTTLTTACPSHQEALPHAMSTNPVCDKAFQLPLSTTQWLTCEPDAMFNSMAASTDPCLFPPNLGNIHTDVVEGAPSASDSDLQTATIGQSSVLSGVSGHPHFSPQTDTALPWNFSSSDALSSTLLDLRDCCQQEQEDLHSQVLTQTENIDSSSLVVSSLSDSSRANNDYFQSQCLSQLISGESTFNCKSMNENFDNPHVFQELQMQSNSSRPVRTYTKVYKAGSVGRSLDVTQFNNYDELRCELVRMFGLGRELDDPRLGWQLVFIDKESDWLLVGDDPWEVFINNVRSIRILSPVEVLKMQDGIDLQST